MHLPLLDLIVNLAITGFILAVIWWALSKVKMPEPFTWAVTLLFAILVVVALLGLLFGKPLLPVFHVPSMR